MNEARQPLMEVLFRLVKWLNSSNVKGVIVGGVAASILGRPRLTRDVDLVVDLDESRWPAFLKSGKAHGFEPRRPDAIAFARQSRVLLMRHRPSRVDVDLIVAGLPFEEDMIRNARVREVGSIKLPLPAPEDLIILKALARRPRDLADIEAIVAVRRRLDRRRILRLVGELAEALDSPEILEKVRPLLATRRKKR